jgi:hypothetical protein
MFAHQRVKQFHATTDSSRELRLSSTWVVSTGAANDGLKPRTTALIIVGLLLMIVAAFAAVELSAGGLIFASSDGDDDDDGGDDEGGDGAVVSDALGEPVDSYKTTDGCLNNVSI